jgi:transglutaminase-like putative cysteine protease
MTGSQRLTFYAALTTVLGMLSLGGVFRTGAWIGPTLLMVAVVALACHGARAARAPRALVPVAGLAALAAALHVYYARSEALLGILPTEASLRRLASLVEQGANDIERLAAPVTVAPGLTLLTAGGVGLVAVAIDTVAVTLRRAALAGLPLLALYSVPAAAAPEGVSWLAFAVGAGGYLALLLAEARERVGRWGRTLAGNRGRYDGSPLSSVGRRVGVAAVAVAIVIPPLVPGLSDGILGLGGGSGVGDGDGSSRVTVDNPILNLGEDLNDRAATALLRFTTDAQKPSYLRRVTLDTFQDGQWFPRQLTVKRDQTVEKGMGEPPGLGVVVPRTAVRTTVEVESRFNSRWLPLPYAAQQVQVDEGRWLFDVGTWNVYSSDTTTRGRRYTVQSVAINPTPEQLAAATAQLSPELADFLAVPNDVGPEVAATAREKTSRATNNYERALALQNWLRGKDFQYSEQAPSASRASAIAAFLQQKSGYCVHFASAMAIMSRQLGIPARVSVGFLPGSADRDRPGWRTVTAKDAHAWPELYFAGIGWVPFEPTPQARTADLAPDYATGPAAPVGPDAGPSAGPSTAPGEEEAIPGAAKAKQLEGREFDATRPDVLAPLTPCARRRRRGLAVGSCRHPRSARRVHAGHRARADTSAPVAGGTSAW